MADNRLDPQSEYTAQGISNNDLEAHRFGEINIRDLFWLGTNRNDSNHLWRKVSETSAEDTKTGERREFKNMLEVYQRA